MRDILVWIARFLSMLAVLGTACAGVLISGNWFIHKWGAMGAVGFGMLLACVLIAMAYATSET